MRTVRLSQAYSRRIVQGLIAGVVTSGIACSQEPVLTRLMEARTLALELRSLFTKAEEAGGRAVLSESDEASAAAAREAEQASATAQRDVDALQKVLESLGYRTELESLARFKQRFAEYQKLDGEILPLASENTNLKAQRLAFGAGQEAFDRFDTAVAAARNGSFDVEAARSAMLEIQVLEERHIAEAEESAMSRIEQRMTALAADARSHLDRVHSTMPAQSSVDLDAAKAALDQFLDVNRQIVELSRRNTNVRSLGLTLGRKRVVAAECEDELRLLTQSLEGHGSEATR